MKSSRNHVQLAMLAQTGFRLRSCHAATAALGLFALAAAFLRPASAAEPAAAAAVETVTFHVTTAGDDRWSGRLATAAADGSDGPFATLDRARRAVRGLKVAGTLPNPVRVEIQEGTFHLAEPLRFTPDDSGSPPETSNWNQVLGPERAVVYAAAAGARPVISGGRRITGWTKGEVAGREAWMAELPEVRAGRWNFTQLWVNGQRAERPRLPRVGPQMTISAASTAATKNTPTEPVASPRAARKPLPIGRADRPDRDARRGAACDPHRPIVNHLANHPRPDGYTRQVGATGLEPATS